ncbi:MAG: hypothetical protein IPN90_12170 [Elusimicrobia bacterium]|nr:hypothetical protein [Elusimicrobiota bacterium]
MAITGTGKIGIGTTSPTSVLHLKAGTAAANTAPLKFTAGTNLTTPEAGAVEFDGTDLYFSTDTATRKTFAFQGSAGTLSGLTPGSVLFATSTASAGQDNGNLFWDNTNKRLGIGTASPQARLEVYGSDISGSSIRVSRSDGATRSIDIIAPAAGGIGKIAIVGTSSPLTFWTDNPSTEKIRIMNSGNVGIGTTTPSGMLDVNQPTAGSVAIQAQTSPTVFWKVVSPAGGITGGYNAANAVEYVAKDSGTNRSINAAGTINASGADFAEWVDWEGPQPDMGSIVKYRGAYVVVSSSATAAFVGNDVKDPRHSILVAFAGQLPVWVKGKVNEGDLIVANGDGTGRAISRGAATLADAQKAVGTAWASSTDVGLKRVHVAVGIGLNGGTGEMELLKTSLKSVINKNNKLEQENAEIQKENAEIKKENIEIKMKTLGSSKQTQ